MFDDLYTQLDTYPILNGLHYEGIHSNVALTIRTQVLPLRNHTPYDED